MQSSEIWTKAEDTFFYDEGTAQDGVELWMEHLGGRQLAIDLRRIVNAEDA